jgi:biotin carboxyl carrier protein
MHLQHSCIPSDTRYHEIHSEPDRVQNSRHIDASINDKDACTTLFYTSRAAAAVAATAASRQARPVAAQAAPVQRNPASPHDVRPPNPRDVPSSTSGSVWSYSLGGSPGQLSPEQTVVGGSSQMKDSATGRAGRRKSRPLSGQKHWALGKSLPTSIPEEEMHTQDIHASLHSNPGEPWFTLSCGCSVIDIELIVRTKQGSTISNQCKAGQVAFLVDVVVAISASWALMTAAFLQDLGGTQKWRERLGQRLHSMPFQHQHASGLTRR